jgi:phage shock protein A
MSGIGDEMGDLGAAIQRAEDKTAQMQARAGAIDELIASGALEDVSATSSGDDIARELDAMSSQADVEAELAALKGGGTTAPQQIEAAEDGDILKAEPEKNATEGNQP